MCSHCQRGVSPAKTLKSAKTIFNDQLHNLSHVFASVEGVVKKKKVWSHRIFSAFLSKSIFSVFRLKLNI